MSHLYLIIDNEDNFNSGPIASANDEKTALLRAEQALEQNPRLEEIFIYKLQKTGKRQSTVAWTDKPKPKPKPKPPVKNTLSNHWQDWTSTDNNYVLEARKEGIPFEQIAADLGRSVRAVEVRASLLRN